MNKKHYIIAAVLVAILAIGIIFTSTTKASFGFWDQVASVAGQIIGEKVYISGQDAGTFKQQAPDQNLGSNSGLSFKTRKVAHIPMLVSSTTLATMYNSDGWDRIITGISYYVQDFDTASGAPRTMTAATSTNAYTLNSNTNYVFNAVIATTSPRVFVASSTPGSTGEDATRRVWGEGTYLNFLLSSLSTSTASGYIEVEYSGN